MDHLQRQLTLSRRRAEMFYRMQRNMNTLPERKENVTQTPRAQAAGTGSESQDRERGGIDGKGKTGKPSDQTEHGESTTGPGETGQDTVHADGPADNSIQPKPD